MSPKFNPKSGVVAGGIAAVTIGGLAIALAMGPATADDNANANTDSSVSADSGAHGRMDRDGDRDGGRHGGPGRDGMRAPSAVEGTVILSDDTFKAEDGNVTVVRHQRGEVTAVSDSAITLKTGSVSRTYVVNADTKGDLANISVGQEVDVFALLDGDNATATSVHVKGEPGQDGHHGARGETGIEPMVGGAGGHHDGPRDGDGGRHLGRFEGGGAASVEYGTRILEQKLIEQADGTLVTVREYRGTVVSVDGSSITVEQADGSTKTFSVPDSVTPERERAAATLADFVAGDEVHIEVTVTDGVESVVAVHGHAAHIEEAADDNAGA